MTQKQKIAICGALAGVLGFLGAISTSLCVGLPVQYQGVCILGGRAAVEAARHIEASMPDAGR